MANLGREGAELNDRLPDLSITMLSGLLSNDAIAAIRDVRARTSDITELLPIAEGAQHPPDFQTISELQDRLMEAHDRFLAAWGRHIVTGEPDFLDGRPSRPPAELL